MTTSEPDKSPRPLSASKLASRSRPQEHVPVAFSNAGRISCWLALIVLIGESWIYSIPTTMGTGGLQIVNSIAYDCLNVWGWGPAVLALIVTSAAVTVVAAATSRGFSTGPAWLHALVAPAPFIAAAGAIPLILFVIFWVLVIALYIGIGLLLVAIIYALITGE